jgi:diguanylate cyclase (GGDEF)-like protein/PAS domain S-box-containing protein
MADVRAEVLGRKSCAARLKFAIGGWRRMLGHDEWWRFTRIGLIGFVAGFVLLVISGQLKTMAGELVAVWLVDGYLLGHTMLLGRRYKPSFLAGAFLGLLLANLMGDETFYVAFSFTFAGMVETCTAALMLPGVKSAKQLLQPKVFVRFVGVCVIAPMLSGLVAALLLQGIFTSHPFSSLSNWVFSDALGFLIFTPVTLVVLSGEWSALLNPANRTRSALLLALIAVVSVAIFSRTSYGELYWMLPPLAMLAFHAELSTVLLGTLLFVAIAVPLTIHGTGPLWYFPFATMQDRVLALQLFTVAALAIVLPIAVLQTQRNALLGALSEGNRRFRSLAERSEEVVMELSAEGGIQYVSPRAGAVLGYEPSLLLGTSVLGLAHKDDRRGLEGVLLLARTTAAERSIQYRFRRADGTYIWVRSFIAAMPSGSPGGQAALAFTVRDVDTYIVEEQKRSAKEEQLRDMAFVDSLTGLRNRRYLDSKLQEWSSSRACATATPKLAVLFIDIDYFKNFNDEYGHPAGDECLKIVAQCIATTIRSFDLLARYGGEEFVVLLENCEKEEAVLAAERIRTAVESMGLAHWGSPLGVVTLSVGVAQSDVNGVVNAGELFKLADSALYAAKREGRNRVGTPGSGSLSDSVAQG